MKNPATWSTHTLDLVRHLKTDQLYFKNGLLSDHSVPPRDDSGRYNDIRERFGHDLTDDQLMCLVDKF